MPARGGSKTIPRKNLAMVAGRPLLAWTAEAVRQSVRLSRTVLSTEDLEIADLGRRLGLEVPWLRPPALAADDTPTLAVLQHVLDTLERTEGYRPAAVALLQPTSPLRRGSHIDDALNLLESSGADSVVSVVRVPHQYNPVSVLCAVDGRLVPWSGGPTVTRRQDKPELFARNGPAVLVTRTGVLARGDLYGVDSRPLVMSAEESIDIDDVWDLELADWLLRRR